MGYILAISLETLVQVAWGGTGARGHPVPAGSSEGLVVTATGLVGLWADGTPRPLGLVVALSGLGCLLSMLLLIPTRSGK